MDYLKLKAFVVNHNTRGKYKFIDNRKNYRKLCLYLIGYKEYLWQDVVPRFVKFLPDDVDVCLISSGKYIETVAKMAEKYNWSYLSTKKNILLSSSKASIVYSHKPYFPTKSSW